MESSGPLVPENISLFTTPTFPTPIVVPLEFIEKQTKAAREDLKFDETGLFIMSKALEEFMRKIMRESTANGPPVLEYDSLAKYIANSEFRALKEFFPERVRFGDIQDRMDTTRDYDDHHHHHPPSQPSSQPSTSSNYNHNHSYNHQY